MAESNSIINIGELAKPATVLIEKVSAAVGGIFAPYQTTRKARADAEAVLIHTRSEIEITELHRRAMQRFVNEEAKRQENIEAITAKALLQLEEKADPQKMDDDWVANFFDKSRIVSDAEMQQLWAKVLAGEANAPGTYSKRTVNFLTSLDKEDAILFAKLCSFGCAQGGLPPLILDLNQKIYLDAGITFSALTHLDNIGLARFENLTGFVSRAVPKRLAAFYYGTVIALEFPKDQDNEFELGKVLLSKAGEQLAPICGSQPNPEFFEYLLGYWRDKGLSPSSPYAPKKAGP